MLERGERASVRDFWRTYGERRSGGSARDAAVTLYAVGLLLLIYFPGVIVASAGWLRAAEGNRAALTADAPGYLVLALVAGLTASFAAGSVRGPVVTHPFLVSTLAGAALVRRVSLGTLALRRVLVLAVLGLAAGLAAVWSLAVVGWIPWSALVVGAAGGAAYGASISVAWLAGQAAAGAWSWAPVAVAGLALVTAFPAAPGLSSAVVAGWIPVVVGVLALAGLAVVPRLLDSLRGPALVAQARRWEGALTLARSGMVSSAGGALRITPSVGRRWRLPRGRSFLIAAATSDIAAAVRMPLRLTGALVGLVAASAMTVAAWDSGLSGAVLWGAGAGLVGFAAIGPFCDGLRHAVDAVTSPRIYGRPDSQVVAAHMAGPAIVTVIVVTATMVVARAPITAAAIAAIIQGVLLVVVRGYDAARGPLPLALTVPVSSPIGDVSGVSIALWQADAALIAASAGVLVALLIGENVTLVGTALVVLLAAGVVVAWRRRLAQ